MGKVVGKHFIIKLGIYPLEVMVSVDEPDDVLLKRLIKFGCTQDELVQIMNLPKTTLGRTVMFTSNHTVIRLKILKDKHKMANSISHEAFHATSFVLDCIGFKLELNVSDEAYAYLLGHIVTEIHKGLKI